MEEENSKLFDPKMEEPQRYALLGKWDSFKNYFQNNPTDDLIEPFNLAGNTAIHVAARSDDTVLIRDLLDMLKKASSDLCRKALRMGNAHKNTLLHQVVLCENVEMVDTVLNYETELKRNLLELRNDLGETPVYRAAKYGRFRMLKRMAKHVDMEAKNGDMEAKNGAMKPHLYRNDFTSILHIAIIGHHFDVALWLTKRGDMDIEKVATAYEGGIKEKAEPVNNEGINNIEKVSEESVNEGRNNNKKKKDEEENDRLSCLQLLSRMPSVFKSYNSKAGFAHKLIYVCLPNKGYDDDDDDDDDDGFTRGEGDLESGSNRAKKCTSPCAVLVSSTIYYATWKLVAREWDSVREIWKTKKQNKQAKKVADILVSIDNSWRNTKHGDPRTEVVVPVIQPSNVAATKKALLEKSTSFMMPPVIKSKDYTPLLLAASTGIIEIVEQIIEVHPDAISHVSPHDEQNVLHVAVKHRQKHIYKHLKKYKALKGLASHVDKYNRTLLHQVARMDYYDGGNQPGVVFQLQEEIHWFERVKKKVPCNFQLFCNKNNLTARELFDLEHSEMLKEAQEWIKGTAQSCSAVSVLVATVVFAAAYTVPGGTDDHGVPNFLNSPLFLFFTVMDVVGLASSLVSVMLFLSILTSPFQMQEFEKSLPRKLTIGFTLLFISLTSTMLAFGSTILLTIRMENKKWSSSLIYSITFFPVTLFGLTQFPIVMAVKYRLKRLWKNVKKIIPKDMIFSMHTKPTCQRDYSKYL